MEVVERRSVGVFESLVPSRINMRVGVEGVQDVISRVVSLNTVWVLDSAHDFQFIVGHDHIFFEYIYVQSEQIMQTIVEGIVVYQGVIRVLITPSHIRKIRPVLYCIFTGVGKDVHVCSENKECGWE